MPPLSETSVLVIGGGFGGLSTACYLADAGADVQLLEKNEQLGGRASRLERDGFRFDMGPSWYLMPDVFERFFGHFGHTPDDYYGLTHLDPHYRIFFKEADTEGPGRSGEKAHDGELIDVTGDREAMTDLFDAYESGAGAALEAYLDEAEHTYEVGMEHFVYEDRSRFRDFIDLDVLKAAPGLRLLGSMQDHVSDYFDHPKLQQVMQYTLVFLGGSPRNTPALYNLMSHVDFNLGVYYPDGGLGGVVDGIVDLAHELGVETITETPATRIAPEGEKLVVETDGQSYRADYVVSDADYAHTEQALLDPEFRQYDESYWESRTYAPSAYLLYLGIEGDVPNLEHHTLVLPTDWNDHFERIFDTPAWPNDPAYYLCVPSKTDDTVAPDGHSNLFVLVPIAPGLADGSGVRAAFRDLILEDIATYTGEDLTDRIVVEESFCVQDFAERYNSYRGSALGLAHTLRQTAPLRPSHVSSELDGLFFTGSYTTPGIGVPMCLISGEITADKVIDHHDP